MEPINGDPHAAAAAPPLTPQQLNPEQHPLFSEGISLLLSRWTALQMAIVNEWGGRNSKAKSEQLASDIFNWFTQSQEPLYIDDLEDMLVESMLEFFNTEIEDGSDEEVAEKLMVMHEEFVNGNYKSVEKLRKSSSAAEAVSQSRRVVNENENEDDDDESSDEEASDMAVDEPKPRMNSNATTVPMGEHKQRETVDEDGWTAVPSRRNRGRNQ